MLPTLVRVKTMTSRTLFVSVCLTTACASYATINGKKYFDFEVEKDFAAVKSRAAFETGCDEGTLKLHPIGNGLWIKQIGVMDCNGQRLVYFSPTNTSDQWLLNSDSREKAEQPRAGAQEAVRRD